MKTLAHVKFWEGQILNIKTQRNVFGVYEGKAKVTSQRLDYIWKYNGYVAVVELMDEHNLDSNFMPIEIADIVVKS